MKTLFIGCGDDSVKFPRQEINTGHTLWSWGESICLFSELTWVGGKLLDAAFAVRSELAPLDLNQFDAIFIDSWAESGNDFLWDALINEYEGALICVYHYPSGYNVEDASRRDRTMLWERNARYDAVFQPSILCEGYYPNALMFPDVVWPVPVGVLEKSLGDGERRENVATLVHSYDMSGQSFRSHFNIRFLVDHGYVVEYTTKQPHNTDMFNEHIQEELGMKDALCVGWLGDGHTSFVSTCGLMFEMQIHPSVSSSIAKAAVAGVPCVGSPNPYMLVLYPEFSVVTVGEASSMISKVKDGDGFVKDVMATVPERLKKYDIEPAAGLIQDAVNEILEEKK